MAMQSSGSNAGESVRHQPNVAAPITDCVVDGDFY